MRLLAIGCSVIVLAGCASGGEDGLDGSDLDGRQFVATDVTGFEPVDDTTISIRFDGDSIGLDAGCNSIGGSYSIDGGRLVVADLFMTEIGCDPERHAQDELLADLVSSVPGEIEAFVELADDRSLALFDGCNDGAGPVEVGADELQLGDIASTRRACEGEASQLVSDAFQGVLASGSSVPFEVDADLLTITKGDRGLVFRASE